MNAEANKKTYSIFEKISKKIENWAATGFHIPTILLSTGASTEIITHISSCADKADVFLSDRDHSSLPPDLLVIAGVINYKSIDRIKQEYQQLVGKKYVVQIGSAPNELLLNGYNIVSDINNFINVDIVIPGNPPSREDIIRGLNFLKDIR
jgi:NADH:ubiquinone oxidoreductase subunit B-like Fe-S oxidoreductase